MCKIKSIINQKGGCGKTTVSFNLGTGLSRLGFKVLLVDMDSQASLAICMGVHEPDELKDTIASVFQSLIRNEELPYTERLIHSPEGVDFISSNIQLAGAELARQGAMSREGKLKRFLRPLSDRYDYILIDCPPAFSMLTVNAMVASDSVIIPIQANYLSAKGMEQLFSSLISIKEELNPELSVDGIVVTMFNNRAKHYTQMIEMVKETYGSTIRVFDSMIPQSVVAPESTACSQSVFTYAKNHKLAVAHSELVKEVLDHEKTGN